MKKPGNVAACAEADGGNTHNFPLEMTNQRSAISGCFLDLKGDDLLTECIILIKYSNLAKFLGCNITRRAESCVPAH